MDKADAGGVNVEELLKRLKLGVDDPMWADHIEMHKGTVRYIIAALQTLTAENARLRERAEAAAAATLRAENSASRWQDIAARWQDEARIARTDIEDTYIPRAEAAESQLSAAQQTIERLTEERQEARRELWNLGLAIGQIAKWPRTYFNRVYVEEWAIRTARILRRWGDKNWADVLTVTSENTKPSKRLARAHAVLLGGGAVLSDEETKG